MIKRIVVSVLALFLLAGAGVAEPLPLSGEALRTVLTGKTVVLNTPVGGIPIDYRDNGTMVGRAKDLSMYVGAERDTGRWWIKSDQVCQKWDIWLGARAYCFTLRVVGRTVHWKRNDGEAGTARLAN